MLDTIDIVTTRADGTPRTTLLHDAVTPGAMRQVANADGLYGWPSPRSATRQRTERHGSYDRSRWLGEKIVSLDGEMWDASIGAAFASFDTVLAAFYETLKTPGLLRWRRAGGGLALQAAVKLAGDIAPPLAEGAALLKWQAQLRQADPRAYSQAATTIVGGDLSAAGGGGVFPIRFPIAFGPSGGGVAIVTNGGIADTPPIIRLYGPLTSPRALLVTTGEQVVLTGDIAAGDYLELDHQTATVRLNGNTLRMGLLDAANSTFFEVPPGVHTIRVLASNYGVGAHGEITTRDAYGG